MSKLKLKDGLSLIKTLHYTVLVYCTGYESFDPPLASFDVSRDSDDNIPECNFLNVYGDATVIEIMPTSMDYVTVVAVVDVLIF